MKDKLRQKRKRNMHASMYGAPMNMAVAVRLACNQIGYEWRLAQARQRSLVAPSEKKS